MPLNISLIWAGVSARERMALVVRPPSRSRVWLSSAAWLSGIFHSGFQAASGLFDIQVAKPSLSQMLLHHSMVTMSPNHWCAIPWAAFSATTLFAVVVAGCYFTSEAGL